MLHPDQPPARREVTVDAEATIVRAVLAYRWVVAVDFLTFLGRSGLRRGVFIATIILSLQAEIPPRWSATGCPQPSADRAFGHAPGPGLDDAPIVLRASLRLPTG